MSAVTTQPNAPSERDGLSTVPPGYKRTDVGIIPCPWDIYYIESLCSVVDGDRGTHYPDTSEFSDSGYCLFLNAGNVTKDGFRFNECAFITHERDALLNKGKLKRFDIVLTTRGTVGNLAYYDTSIPFEYIRINSGMVILRSESPLLDTRFLFATLQSHAVRSQIERLSFGSAQPQLTVKGISKIRIIVPPLPEQRAIAAALSDADGLIGALDALIEKKRAIKQAAMQQLLTGKKRLPGFSGEWEMMRTEDIGRFKGGSGFPTKFQGETSGDYPFFKVSDMSNEGNEIFMETANNYISEGVRKQLGATVFPEKSIVFAKVGAAIFLERKKILAKASCLDNNMAAFVIDDSLADCRFLHYILLNIRLGDLVNITALPSISRSVLSTIELQIPSLPEQRAIAAVLSDMDAEIAALERRREKTKQIKQGMMQQLLTGRIRLVEPPEAAT